MTRRIRGIALVLLILISNANIWLQEVTAEEIPDTDSFSDTSCGDSKKRLRDLAKELIALGWTFFMYGYKEGAMYLTFMYAIDDTSIGDPGEYRSGKARFSECNSDEFTTSNSWIYNQETEKWEKRTDAESIEANIDWTSVAGGVLITVIVIGILSILYSGGPIPAGGGGGGNCAPFEVVPTYGLCPW